MTRADPAFTRCMRGGSFVGLEQAAQVRANTHHHKPALVPHLGPITIVRRGALRQRVVPCEAIRELRDTRTLRHSHLIRRSMPDEDGRTAPLNRDRLTWPD